MAICPHCKGAGKLDVTVHCNGNTQIMTINCSTCNSTGTMSEERRAAIINFERNFWCKCGNKSQHVTFHDDIPCVKHHWTCDECGKVTQIG